MLKMYKLAYAISRHTKKAADHYNTPLYKPLEVSVGGMELEAKVLDVLHSIHNSSMYLLGTTDEVTAHVLNAYFDKYLTDMQKMDDIKNDVKREGDMPWDI
jgi:hypothetical protein